MPRWWHRLRARFTEWVSNPNCLRCGCSPVMHDHYRRGSDCGRCGAGVCPSYR